MFIEVLSDLEKETKLEDTTLSPGQTINGSVVFQVNSLYNKTFLLMYNKTPITSASFEISIEALSTAERYNYSVIFGRPPYSYGDDYHAVDPDSYEPNGYPWANWVNRGIFEVFNKADIELFNKDISVYMSEPSKNYISGTEFVYALRVIPERNITLMFERNIKAYPESYPENQQTQFRRENGKIVDDDTGEELVHRFQSSS